MSLFLMYCCMAHILFVPFLEISRVSGNRNPSFTPSLIIITVLTNNSSIFCSSLKFLHFDMTSGDGGTTTSTIFMCHLFFVLLVRLNWQVYFRDSFQLPRFLPGSKQTFYNTFSFSGREEGSTDLWTFWVLQGVSQFQQISPSLLDNQVFLPVVLTACFKTIFHLGTISFAI